MCLGFFSFFYFFSPRLAVLPVLVQLSGRVYWLAVWQSTTSFIQLLSLNFSWSEQEIDFDFEIDSSNNLILIKNG